MVLLLLMVSIALTSVSAKQISYSVQTENFLSLDVDTEFDVKQRSVQPFSTGPINDQSSIRGITTNTNPSDSGFVGPTLDHVLTTRFGAVNDVGGACALPEASYAVTLPVALGDIPALQQLAYHPGMCGHILTIDCGHGPVDIIVANSNLGGGLDLYGTAWDAATGSQPPGEAYCSVDMTDKNPLNGDGPVCYYDPSSDKNNDYFHLLMVLNTNGRVVSSATLDGRSGSFNGVTPYFAFNFGPVPKDADVVFTFEDGSTSTVALKDCISENDKHPWS